MVIIDPNGMTFDAVVVFGLVFHILFKSFSSYYETIFFHSMSEQFLEQWYFVTKIVLTYCEKKMF